MVDTNATIAFLEQATDLRDTAQVTTFRASGQLRTGASRKSPSTSWTEGSMQEPSVTPSLSDPTMVGEAVAATISRLWRTP